MAIHDGHLVGKLGPDCCKTGTNGAKDALEIRNTTICTGAFAGPRRWAVARSIIQRHSADFGFPRDCQPQDQDWKGGKERQGPCASRQTPRLEPSP